MKHVRLSDAYSAAAPGYYRALALGARKTPIKPMPAVSIWQRITQAIARPAN